MTLATATGPIAIAQELLRTTLSNCTAFQTLVGAANAAAALARIHNYDAPPPELGADSHTLEHLQAIRPCAAVWTYPQEGLTLVQDSGGWTFGFHEGGNLVCRIEGNIGDDDIDEPAKLDRYIANTIGAIITSGDLSNPGLLELAGQAGYLAIRRLTYHGWYPNDDLEQAAQGGFWRIYLDIFWGLQ